MMAAWLDEELATSTAESVTTTAVIICLSSPGQARMSPLRQSSSGRCPNHRLWRDGKPTESCVPFLCAPRCSRPKAPHLDDADLRPSSPRHQRLVKGKPRSTRSNREQGTSPHPFTAVLAIAMMHATSSTRVKGTRRMEPAVVTTLDGAATTTAGRTRACPRNPWDHKSLVKTSATRHSRHDSGNLPTSPSTLGKRTSSFGLMTTSSPTS
jgi:hypothetical protein